MTTTAFTLNTRFEVEPNLNLVKDMEQEKEFRLEPRLMKLLCLLAQNREKLVTRETITKEIWDNYGNPDESLTQAISYLRKVLSDQQRKLIETVPKKGYVFHATLTELVPESTIPAENKDVLKRKYKAYPAGILLLVTVVSVILFFFFRAEKKQTTENQDIKELKEVSSESKLPSAATTEIAFPDLNQEDDDNYLNTVTTTDSLGTKYRLVMIGDRRPEFYVNDSLQSNHELYDDLIDKLAKELWRRQKEAEKK